MKGYLGVDVGSVSTNVVLLDQQGEVAAAVYLRTQGQPIPAVQRGLSLVTAEHPGLELLGVGVTGSGRELAGVMLGADVIKNEITAHAVAASRAFPGVQTVLEIGGQDSKLILLRHGVVSDFAMNTVCAAGTGSFLDQQAARLGIPIEDFGGMALKAGRPVRIAGRCAVFAESDMIHKQQVGHPLEGIVAGLCEALVRNYLSNLGKGKQILPPVVFQGGVAANEGMRQAFNKALGLEVSVPRHYSVMGALGAALLAIEAVREGQPSAFRGFGLMKKDFRTSAFTCNGCANRCEVVQMREGRQVLARWGSRCGKWEYNQASLRQGAG